MKNIKKDLSVKVGECSIFLHILALQNKIPLNRNVPKMCNLLKRSVVEN